MAKRFNLRLQPDYLKFLLKRNARYMGIMSAAMVTLYPILVITAKILSRGEINNDIREVGVFFNLFLLLFTSVMIPLQLLGYLNVKKNLDVYHALPIKRTDLLVTTLVATLIVIAVPFAIGWISGGLITLTDSFTFVKLFERGFAALMIAFAIATITVFTMMNTGTSLDAFLYSLALNFLPILAFGAYVLFVQTILLGFDLGELYKIIGIIFPFYALFESGYEIPSRLWESGWLNGAYWLLIAGVIATISGFFYQRRKSEKAENPFTNKVFFPAVSGLVISLFIVFLYCVVYSMNTMLSFASYYDPINFIFPFFFSLVLYLVMDAIAQRSFKHLGKAFLHYLVIALISFGLLIGGLLTKGFGYASALPTRDDITSVEVQINDYSGYILNQSFNRDYMEYNPNSPVTLTLTSPEDIDTIFAMHEIMVKEYRWIEYNYNIAGSSVVKLIESVDGYTSSYEPLPFDLQYDETLSFRVTYRLDTGGSMSRSYTIPVKWAKVLTELNNSPEALAVTAPSLADVDTYKTVNKAVWSTFDAYKEVRSTDINLSQLRNAYLQDLAKLSDEDFMAADRIYRGSFSLTVCKTENVCVSDTLVLDDRFPKTLALVEGWAALSSLDLEMTRPTASILILPQAQSGFASLRSSLFHVAFAPERYTSVYDMLLNPNLNNDKGESAYGITPFTYVLLTPEQVIQIQPYLVARGHSQTALMSLQNNLNQGNLLVSPWYVDEVNLIIAGNERFTATDPYQVFDGSIPK
jgi:ABC-2 type transport system permease protein